MYETVTIWENFSVQLIDLIALLWLGTAWVGYNMLATKVGTRRGNLLTQIDHYNSVWMNRMLMRENRITDLTAIANLQRSISFFASTSILLQIGLVTMLGYGEQALKVIETVPFAAHSTAFLWEFKIFLLMIVFIYAFFKFTWSLRQYNYASIYLCAAPMPLEAPDTHAEWADRGQRLLTNAARHFNLGMRAYYYGLAIFAWFIHGWAFVAATTLVIYVLYRREFVSRVHNILASSAMPKMLLALALIMAAQPAHAHNVEAYCGKEAREKYIPIAQRREKAVFFHVSSCGRKDSYLLGTVHSDDLKLVEMNREAFNALKTSREAAFEIVADATTQNMAMGYMTLPPEEQRSLRDIIGPKAFSRLSRITGTPLTGMPENFLLRYRPWAAAILLQYPATTSDGVPLDARLQAAAYLSNVPLVALEKIEDQFDVFLTMPEREQITMLHDTLSRLGDINDDNDRLFALYFDQDLWEIARLGKEAFDAIEDPKLRKRLQDDLIHRRNRNMAEAALPRLEKGNLFIAVGALHLPGKGGLFERIEKSGYFIFPAR